MIRIIEKRSAQPEEQGFYRMTSSQRLETAPAPELYAAFDAGVAERNPLRYVLFLKYLPPPGLPDRSAETACLLADSMAAVARLKLPPTFRPQRALQLSEGLLSEFLPHAEAAGLEDPAARRRLEKMVIDWPQILTIRSLGLPVFPSHNDLHPGNICFVPERRDTKFAFIDWEHFAMNCPGAELHHFLRETILTPSLSPFFEALRSRFLKRMQDVRSIDGLMIDLGAHAYALTRSMHRVVWGREASDLSITLEICDRLKQLLASR